MNHESDQFNEIAKKSLFGIYITLTAVSILMATVYLCTSLIHHMMIAIFLALCGTVINIIGRRHYDFERFLKALQLGPVDDVSIPDIRLQIENIISQSNEPDIDWVKRDNLRKQLESLMKNRSHLFRLYKKEIKALHPVLAIKLQSKKI